jgi:hypothetical protein
MAEGAAVATTVRVKMEKAREEVEEAAARAAAAWAAAARVQIFGYL